jgi:membrane protease YdiL (CAAX protease family)
MTPQARPGEPAAAERGDCSAFAFFVLVLALAVPFWILGAFAGVELMPGLPIAALAVVCPALAGLILATRESGLGGALRLLKRALDVGRISPRTWLLPALLIPPGVAVLCWFGLRLTGTPVPTPQIAPGLALSLAAAFFVAAICEELGWSGYVLDPLQTRFGWLAASLVVAVVWIVFHYVPLAQAHRPPAWIAWWTLGTLSMRVIMVWLYNRAGASVFAVSLFHMAANLAWQLFPVRGSFFDPRWHGLLMAAIALALVGWEATTRRPIR